MTDVVVVDRPTEEQLEALGARDWPIWSCGVSFFPWTYDETETCFFVEGEVIVTPEGGDPVRVGEGQLVTFQAGMSCTWDVRHAVRKHYRFS